MANKIGLAKFFQRYAARRLPGPGTGNFAYLPWQTLPKHSPGGPGVTYIHGMRSIQEPQLYQDRQIPIDGINGITSGDIQLFGLTDMEADNFDFLLSGNEKEPGTFTA